MEREKKDLSFILILLSTLIGIAVLFLTLSHSFEFSTNQPYRYL